MPKVAARAPVPPLTDGIGSLTVVDKAAPEVVRIVWARPVSTRTLFGSAAPSVSTNAPVKAYTIRTSVAVAASTDCSEDGRPLTPDQPFQHQS
jgi:hypothetical protein